MRDPEILVRLELRAERAAAHFERTKSDSAATAWAMAVRAVCVERSTLEAARAAGVAGGIGRGAA